MTKEEFDRLEFGDKLVSNIDGTTVWYFYAQNVSICVYKTVTTDVWGHEVFLDRLHFSIGNFLMWFESNKEKVKKSFVDVGGNLGEPYSIVYPNFHILETNTIDLF